MDVTITASTVSGAVRAPSSKGYSHRAILAGGYASGARINRPLLSADTRATARAVDAFDGDVSEEERDLDVVGFEGAPAVPADVIDCAGSGTTMRMAAATAALAHGTTVLTGDESLRARPQEPLLDAIEQLGGRAESTRGNGRAPLVIGGPVDGGTVSFPDGVSPRFVTPMLMAGAVTDEGVRIETTGQIESPSNVAITRDVLDAFGVTIEESREAIQVPGGQFYEPTEGEYSVPSDFSSISYLLAAGAVAADDEVNIRGAFPNAQGETAIVELVEEMGGDVDWDRDDGILDVRRSALHGVVVDVVDTPDLLPTVAALGACASGTTRIENATTGRVKTVGRSSAMAEELTRLGARVEEVGDDLIVHGGESTLTGSTVDGRRDHRIIMALAVVGLVAEGETTVTDAEYVDASFPGFFEVLYDLGADVRH